VRGDLTGDLNTSTARTLSIAGAVSGSVLTLTGLTTLSAAGGITGSSLNVTGAIGTISARGGISTSTIAATGNIRTISAPIGITTTTITASNITTLSSAAPVTSSTITAGGSITNFTARSLIGDTITAGVAAGVTLANVTSANIGAGLIQNLHLTSRITPAFSDTTVIANKITSGSLGSVSESNGGIPEGVAIAFTRSLSVTEGGTIVRLTAQTTGSPPAFGDFEILVV
jgi:hypothetical protein